MDILLAILPWLIGLFLAAVVATLFTGLLGMMQAGEFNKRYGNKLMRLRVILQGITIALFMIYIVLMQMS
jgi:tetrahydromethanopterin S-methyltransferase subunit G